ncbi:MULTISPECIES: VOC family protein [Halomonas]|uniref:VOC family protein n=1 Tax=Halomonas TaxID=2745 RepID=UPI001A8D514B|nr:MULTISPECIES: VOC family protein [Halomonas]MBN8411892.1 VOC family protein [Halomonas litopenaei]MBY5926488.1 VOC family protein [Halomonas sp. DP4Y7-2]MBY5930129.1 VOC family protein [Halomonas sp. DP8Y7-3]MBY5985524.1 VOC family protein [Halomonas sp. DP5Y7-2]MBY6209887.1 VOC family protein [Halomonas sp. DP3Y7-2]
MSQAESPTGPTLDRVLETALYVADMAKARQFFESALGLSPFTADHRFTAYQVGPSVLLLFLEGGTLETVVLPDNGGTIPPHDGRGWVHMAFAIRHAELAAWESRLHAHGVEIEGRTRWSRGGESLYFRDPDGHLLELATPGVWPHY